ncbi:MAG TPA: MBL fold metallo-hydrolase [Patescibacteria group bacterium]|nr:MBL fold metallo-hydrolase [Patescibacteria group bacterium]
MFQELQIKTFSLGGLDTNYYLLYTHNEGVIIDPGDEATFIAEKIQEFKFSPCAIVATHGHFDHVLAAGELQLIFNIPFYLHQNDLFLLKNMCTSATHWLGRPVKHPIPQKIITVQENDVIGCADYHLKIIETPGHTPGSICLTINFNQRASPNRSVDQFDPFKSIVFTGDTLFKGGIGRYDFSYSSKEELDGSLRKLEFLPQETVIYPGHGEATTIGHESPAIL